MPNDLEFDWANKELRSSLAIGTIVQNREGRRFSIEQIREVGVVLYPVAFNAPDAHTKDAYYDFEPGEDSLTCSWSDLKRGRFGIVHCPLKEAIIQRGIRNYSDFLFVNEHVAHNRKEVAASETCGCIFCLGIFSPEDMWEDERAYPRATDLRAKLDYVRCPRCDMDMVIGSASGYPITAGLPEQLHDCRFPESPVSWVREAYRPRTNPQVRHPELFRRWKNHDLILQALIGEPCPLYRNLAAKDIEKVWLFIEESYLGKYTAFIGIGFDYGSSGLWLIPFPGSSAYGPMLEPEGISLPLHIAQELKAWVDYIDDTSGFGHGLEPRDDEMADRWGLEVAMQVRKVTPPNIYVEFHPFRELVIQDGDVVELEVPELIRRLGQG
ncbi:MAG: hypothetical protein M1570_12760 [Chloroflexi bacterium]|nr:hypothetical protein [Chloroflexota bacterium]